MTGLEKTAVAELYGELSRRLLVYFARNVLGEYFERGRVERRALRRLGLRAPAVSDDEIARIEELAGLARPVVAGSRGGFF